MMDRSGFLRLRMVSSGFLLMELMAAILIGLVFISALMRMQAVLLELNETFCVRGGALNVALDFLECDATSFDASRRSRGNCAEPGRSGQRQFTLKSGERDFEVSFDKSNQSNSSTNYFKIKVGWQSIVGKKRCVEL